MMSFCVVPASSSARHALALGRRRRRARAATAAVALIVIDVFMRPSGISRKSVSMSSIVADRHADLADLAARERWSAS